jgi:hypothetical protein
MSEGKNDGIPALCDPDVPLLTLSPLASSGAAAVKSTVTLAKCRKKPGRKKT